MKKRYLTGKDILDMNYQKQICVKEFLILKYLHKGIGEVRKRRLKHIMLYNFDTNLFIDEWGIRYWKCKVNDVIFIFRSDLKSGELDGKYNFMVVEDI